MEFHELQSKALELGWDDIGITSATIPEYDVSVYHQWIQNGCHGDMKYMENAIRCSPTDLFPGAKSAIIFVTYYKQEKEALEQGKGLVASYARGRDYHHVHRKRLKKYIAWMEEKTGQEGIAKGFSDSTPIMEKSLAVQAGLGWIGKNTLLIHRRFGTFTLLSGILTSLDLPHTPPKLDLSIPRCGSCTRCIDACPTQALNVPYLLDARKCLSYHLIESKNSIPKEISLKNPGYIFGCDICQDACPHNVLKKPSNASEFSSEKGVGPYIDENTLQNILRNPETLFGTPLQRKGAKGLEDNFYSLSH